MNKLCEQSIECALLHKMDAGVTGNVTKICLRMDRSGSFQSETRKSNNNKKNRRKQMRSNISVDLPDNVTANDRTACESRSMRSISHCDDGGVAAAVGWENEYGRWECNHIRSPSLSRRSRAFAARARAHSPKRPDYASRSFALVATKKNFNRFRKPSIEKHFIRKCQHCCRSAASFCGASSAE